jgi:uncharacterized protein YbjT (DUF2867 family)
MNAKGTVVVLGATGRQGGAAARHLLADGWPVRVLVRDSDKPAAKDLAAAGAEVVPGDMLEPATLRDAFAGAYGVFSVQTWRGPGGVDAEKRAGLNVADAAAAVGVSHLVYSSVGGADRAPELAHFASKFEIEQRIAALGVPATVLRPVFFMDNFRWQREGILAGRLVQGAAPTTRLQMIAVDDIGALAALAFREPDKWIGRTIEIAGDELTLVEAAAVLSERVGKPVVYVSEHEDRPGGGDEARKMASWFDTHGFSADIPSLRAIYRPLTDFRSYVATAEWLDS